MPETFSGPPQVVKWLRSRALNLQRLSVQILDLFDVLSTVALMIVACVGQKGGVGKSTIAVAIAAELAARRKKVLLVDADPQGTATTWHDVATEEGHEAPTVIAMTGALHKPNQLPKLAADFDHVVIDTPPRLAETQRSAMMVATIALLPCGPSTGDVWAIAASVKVVTEARDFRPKLKAAIILNRVRAGTTAAKGAREALGDSGLPVLKSELGLRQAFSEALAAGLGVGAYAPHDLASSEVTALVDELLSMGGRQR